MTARRVLLIDDEDHIREVAKLSLELTAGWHVLTASGGAEGIALAADAQPDAVLLDMMMPDMDGMSTARALLADPATRAIPIVFLSAKARTGDPSAAPVAGAAGSIAKPFDPMRLADQLASLLGWDR